MALVLANRVQETTTTTGTGTITLAGAVSGFQSFAAIGNANTTYYTITSGTAWEVGIGTYTSAGTTLARTTILASSAAGAAITLAGTSVVFATYPAEKSVNYDASNNVGIGTTGPAFKLDVNSAATTATRVTGPDGVYSDLTNGTGTLRFQASSSSLFVGSASNGPLAFNTNSAERMRITATGDVGIGLTAPGAKLQVQGDTLIGGDGVSNYNFKLQRLNGGIRAVQNDFAAATNSPWILHGENLVWTGERAGTVESTQAYRPYYEAYAPAVGYKEFGFVNVTSGSFTGTNLIPSLVITNTGNVGIGPTAPAGILDVRASNATSINSYLLNTVAYGAGNTAAAILNLGKVESGTVQVMGAVYAAPTADTSSTSGFLSLYTRTSSAITEKMRITSVGEVFVGKTAASVGTDGAQFIPSGFSAFSAPGTTALFLNRNTNDGTILEFGRNGVSAATMGLTSSALTFGTAGSERMRITSTGNVGIGTATVGSRLDIVGGATQRKIQLNGSTFADVTADLYIGRTGTSSAALAQAPSIQFGNATDASGVILQGSDIFQIWTNLAGAGWNERMRITSLGDVLINTTASLYGYASNPSLEINGAAAAVLGLKVAGAAGSYIQHSGDLVIANTTANNMRLFTNNTEKMRITSGGDVGIGTSAPLAPLAIVQSGASYGAQATNKGTIQIAAGPASLNAGGGLEFLTSTFSNGYGWKISSIDSTGVHLVFGNRSDSATWTERMRIDSSGNVGIGTASPGAKLDVSGNIRLSAASPNIEFNNGGGMVYGPAGNTLAFATGGGPSSPTERMRITSAGFVGVGTSSPGSQFENVGQTRLGANVSAVAPSATDILSTAHTAMSGNGGNYLTIGQYPSGQGFAQWIQSSFSNPTTATYNLILQPLGGNVGIGVASPGASTRLNVAGRGLFTSGSYDPSDGTASGVSISYDTGNNVGIIGAVQTGVSEREMRMRGNTLTFFTNGANERMRITSTGDVGIGTSSPGARLELSKASGAADLRLSVAGTLYANIYASASDTNLISVQNLPLIFGTSNAERMRISGSGLVGIATTTPSTTLEVNGGLIAGSENRQTHPPTGPVGFKAQWNFTGGFGETDFYNLYSSASDSFRFYQTTGSGTAQLLYDIQPSNHQFYTGGSERVRIDSSGNVGIGTSSPTYRFEVKGNPSWFRNFNGTPASPTEAQDWPVAALNIASFGDYSLQTMLAFTLPNDGNYFTDFSVWNFKLDQTASSTTSSGVAGMLFGGPGYLAFTPGGSEKFRIASTGAITSSALADAVGYKGLPQNSQTSSYTLALTDMGKHISITTGGVVIPANGSVAFPIGSAISIFNNSGSNQTISITTDTLRLAGTATTGSRTLAQYGVATCLKVTSTVWVISGAGVT